MELALPVAIGIGAALVTTWAFIALRDRSFEGLGWPLARPDRSEYREPVGVEPAPPLRPPVKRGRRVARLAPRETNDAPPASSRRRRSKPGARPARVSDRRSAAADDHDVIGHGPFVAADDAEAGSEVNGGVAEGADAESIYWRTDGSTDCPGCASSRLRGARFCLRCGRLLV